MAHCPQCGTLSPDATKTCPSCGLVLALVKGRNDGFGPASRTIMGGVATADLGTTARIPAAALLAGHDPDTTIQTGTPDFDTVPDSRSPFENDPSFHGFAPAAPPQRTDVPPATSTATHAAPAPGLAPATRTLLGVLPDAKITTTETPHPLFGPRATLRLEPPSPPAQSTLLGVAHPGIAPLSPGVSKTPLDAGEEPPNYQPADELGATLYTRKPEVPPDLKLPPGFDKKRRFARAVHMPAPKAKEAIAKAKASKRRGLLMLAAALIVLGGGILVAVFWPASPPLRVQVRPADGVGEVLDVTCSSCPDGTTLTLDDKVATVRGGRAVLPLTSEPPIGETPMKIAIDRPSGGRDETISVSVRVGYRIRPDLTTLQADRPALQIVVDAERGSKVVVDGTEVPLVGQKAVLSIDVTKDLSGTRGSAESLERKVSYEVTLPQGNTEKGVVSVSVASLPLVIDAPGPSVVTAESTFVLAGRTLPGAEIAVAGRAIEVQKDGTFARAMNVSSIGTTQVEVRAKMAGKAPRLAFIDVERVASLEAAATDFEKKKSPIDYPTLIDEADAAKGKAVRLDGEIAESKALDQHTVFVLHVKTGCKTAPCPVRVDLGARRTFAPGDQLRVFGVAGGVTRPESIPEVFAAFVIAKTPATDTRR